MESKLDLHGVKHIDVPRKVDKFIGDHLMRGSREVNIIIGHSDTMKKIIDKTLEDYNIESEYHFLTPTILSISLK
jgi:DNA-nicking Smr family endonuclease